MLLTLLKLGGSVITNKEVPMQVNQQQIDGLVKEISIALPQMESRLVVGHGAGSFAHAPAMKYKTKEGLIDESSLMGLAITHDVAAQLNRIIVRALINQELPVISWSVSASMVTEQMQAPAQWWSEVILRQLELGLIPVTYGDVMIDSSQGCTVWSTDTILSFLAQQLPRVSDHTVDRVIHVTETAGVLDDQGQTIPEITRRNSAEVKQHITPTKGFDVTGGMWHKIEESLELVDQAGTESWILSGTKPGNLRAALTGGDWVGTVIKG